MVHMIFSGYVNLIFSLLGIGINLLLLVILSHKKILADKMYTFLLINSCSNMLQSVIITIKFLLQNLEEDVIAITDIQQHKSVLYQYNNLILIKFFSSVFRTESNLSYLAFALSRYITIRNKKKSLLNRFHRINIKLFIFVSIAFSLLINIQVFFQFKIKFKMTDWEQGRHFSAKNFSSYYRQEPIDDYKENFSSESEYLFFSVASQYLRVIFSDLTHIIAVTVIDIVLFIFVKQKITLKKRLLHANSVLSLVTFNSKQKKRSNHEKPKDRISAMIILNGFNWLFFRCPLALSSFYGFMFRYDRKKMKYEPNLASYIICKKKNLCISLQEIFVCLYLISFLNQFFIFYKLDTNFKLCIDYIRKKIKKKNEL